MSTPKETLAEAHKRFNLLDHELGTVYDNDPEDELGLPPGETNGFVAWRIEASRQHPLHEKVVEYQKLWRRVGKYW